MNRAARSLGWPIGGSRPAALAIILAGLVLPVAPGHGALRIQTGFGDLPMMFEANSGQFHPSVKFLSRGPGYSLFLGEAGISMTLVQPFRSSEQGQSPAGGSPRPDSATSVQMRFVGANPAPILAGCDELPGKINYLTGAEQAGWRTNISTYGKVRYSDVYPGVDVVFYGVQRELEYDFIVAPGIRPEVIALTFEGADSLCVDERGDLVIATEGGEIRQESPFVYQIVDGEKRQIPGAYRLLGPRGVGFAIGDYDRETELVIDPVLSYSTLFPIEGTDQCRDIAVDSAGSAYVVGWTTRDIRSPQDPLFPPPLLPRNRSVDIFNQPHADAFIAKLNPTGSAVVYWTYLGGSNADEAFAVAVDASGNAVLGGRAISADFPTLNAFQPTRNGPADVFLTKLNASGTALVYSTYLGGSDFDDGFDMDIRIGADGHVFLAGQTQSRTDFPVTENAFQRTSLHGGFLTRIDPGASGAASLVYSTAVGMQILGMAIDESGFAYLAGTGGGTFPTTVNAFQRVGRERYEQSCFCYVRHDALVVKLDTEPDSCTPSGDINCQESLVYASYLGGTDGQYGHNDKAVAVGAHGGLIYVFGTTGSIDFPTTPGAFQASSKADGRYQAFFSVLDPNPPTCTPDPSREINCLEGLVYSTYLGGNPFEYPGDEGMDMALDAEGNAYVTGRVTSADFPVKSPFQPFRVQDVFVSKLNPRASGDASLIWSTFLGGIGTDYVNGIALDSDGSAYLTGTPSSTGFPMTPGAFFRDYGRAYIAKISENPDSFFVSAISPEKGGDPGQVSVTVYGAGFVAGAEVKLMQVGEPSIVGEAPLVSTNGRAISARFDLTGRTRGLWDVVVTNPDGSLARLAQAFSIEAAKPPAGSVSIAGRENYRPGGTGRIVVTYSNRSNVDILLPVIIRIPEGIGFSLPVPLLHQPLIEMDEPVDFSELDTTFHREDDPNTPEDEGETVIPIIVHIPPESTGGIPINLNHPPANCAGIRIRAEAGQPIGSGAGRECFSGIVELAAGILSEFIPAGECIKLGYDLAVKASADVYRGQPSSLSSWIASVLLGAVKCAADLFPVTKAIKIAVKVTDIVIGKGYAVLETFNACQPLMVMQPGPGGPGTASLTSQCVSSRDPNDKSGLAGFGAGGHFSGQETLPFLIQFENKPDATAAAQTVVISDPLDKTKLDLATLQLGMISFGNHHLFPPPGLTEFMGEVDMRPATDLLVRIHARLDPESGVLTWRFESIDPATGEPTEDPLAGFLPPNISPPLGDGAVLFTVAPQEGLTDGAQIRNKASIVFDFNDAIETPEWLNTVDLGRPDSRVLPFSGPTSNVEFPVTWTGSDGGAGIASYQIYVARDGGPFSLWLDGVTGTSAIFTGSPNSLYAFYSVATDLVGNVELPGSADAATRTGTPLDILLDDDEVVLRWTIPGRLQSAASLDGPFEDEPGARSPFFVDLIPGGERYWRIVP